MGVSCTNAFENNVLRSRELGRKLGSSSIKENYDFFAAERCSLKEKFSLVTHMDPTAA